MRSPQVLLGIGLLGSSLFLSQVHAAPRTTPSARVTAAPVRARVAPRVAATRLAKPTATKPSPKFAAGKLAPTPASQTEKPTTIELAPHQTQAVAKLADDKFTKLIGLFGAPRATIKLTDPTSKQGTDGVEANGKTFVDGVSYKDVDQGYLGDCYFVAALTAVAYTHPELIKKDLVEKKDGSLSLRMYHMNASGKYEADTVNMSKAVPLANGTPSFARGADPTQMWPAYFQKGFVMQKAGTTQSADAYQAIEGGLPGDAFATLTGKPSQRYSVNPAEGDQLFTVMQHANQAKAPVAAWTPHDLPEGGIVHGDHTYTVLGVSEHDGKKFVQLRNPWGFSPGTDGIFELDIPTFAKTFVGLDVGGL